jgi:hypothetical protein
MALVKTLHVDARVEELEPILCGLPEGRIVQRAQHSDRISDPGAR